MQKTTWEPGNRILESLSLEVCQRLRASMQRIELPVGKVLFDPESEQNPVYFPRSGLVSLSYVMENGDTGEVAMVGCEGLVGVTLLVDSTRTPNNAQVRIAGEAWAVRPDTIEKEFQRGEAFQRYMLRYTQYLISQMAQAAICNRHHIIERQVARWLLQASDRIGGDELPVTHDGIANLLGVRREGVTEAAGKFQDAGLIANTRGRIRIIDRHGLEQRACECYGLLNREYQRLLGEPIRA